MGSWESEGEWEWRRRERGEGGRMERGSEESEKGGAGVTVGSEEGLLR